MSFDFDLDDLRCFVAAADAPSFRAAARHVALSPAAFTSRIQKLEGALDAQLFSRTTRSVSTTAAGRRLLPHARQLLQDTLACRELVRLQARPLPFELTLGTRYELGLSWLFPALDPLATARPDRTVHLYMGGSPDLFDRLRAGDVDAVVTSARLTLPNVAYATLHAEHYVFVTATDKQIEGPEDVQDLALVDIGPDLTLFRYLLDALPDSRPWPFTHHHYMGGIAAIRAGVLKGMGIAVLPEYFVRADLKAGRMRRLLPEVELRTDAFRMVWRSTHPLEHEIRELAAALGAMPLQ